MKPNRRNCSWHPFHDQWPWGRSLPKQRGTVLGVSRSTTGLTVLIDGDRRPTCLHRDYISPAQYYRAPRLGG